MFVFLSIFKRNAALKILFNCFYQYFFLLSAIIVYYRCQTFHSFNFAHQTSLSWKYFNKSSPLHLLELFYHAMSKCVCRKMLLINRSVLWIFIRHFHSFNRTGAYMAITLKLRFVLFNASDTFTRFTLRFFFYTKTS